MKSFWPSSEQGKLIPVVAACCVVLVAICYANSFPNEFLSDDYMLVAVNPVIRTITPIRYLLSPFWGDNNSEYGIYRPAVILSFSLDYSVWKRWEPGFHLTNMLLHALNGVLVFVLARGLLGSVPAAGAAGAIFLAHPVHAESVASIAGRSELLAGTFFFTAWLLFRQGRTGLCALAFLVSMLSKENAVAFPLVVALDVWISNGSLRNVLAAWKRFSVLGASMVVYFALRIWVLGQLGMPRTSQYLNGAWTVVERELTSARSFLTYFQLLLTPVNVTGNYDFNSIPIAGVHDWDAWLGVFIIVASAVLAFRFSKKNTALSFGILFFFASMLPMSNWIVPGGVLVAERYLYVPSFGLAIIAGMLWTRIKVARVRHIVAAGVLVPAILLCISHCYIWRNDFTYYSNMARVFPNNARARQGYGVALFKARRLDEAKAEFEAGLKIQRTTPLLVGLAGQVIGTERSCVNARPLIDEALAMAPKDYFARWLLAECYDYEGRVSEAEQTYRRAVADTPFPDSRLLFDWGMSLERIGKHTEAADAYRRAALVDPDNEVIQQKLASIGAERQLSQ
jgi:hypothetical protein